MAQDKTLQLEDYIYESDIQTVQFYKEGEETAYPYFSLKDEKKIILSFDHISSEPQNYYATLINCDSKWEESNLIPGEYWNGIVSQSITNYQPCKLCKVKFIHYKFELENHFLKSGNYLLKIYKDGDEQDLIITRRLVVTEDLCKIEMLRLADNDLSNRRALQNLSFQIDVRPLNVINPQRDIYLVVLQNGRWDNARKLDPLYILPEKVEYALDPKNDFSGGNEFRKLDLRSLIQRPPQMESVEILKTSTEIRLTQDLTRSFSPYFKTFDFNGSYYILNKEYGDNALESDYFNVTFRLKMAEQITDGEVYVFGKLSDWRTNDFNRMKFNQAQNEYSCTMRLKQGVYDYEYVIQTKKGLDETRFEGSFFETENFYTVLIYYQNPADRTSRVVGVKHIGYN